MRVLITGGTGLIGKALGETLASDYEVIALSRSPQKYEGQMPSGVKLHQWDAKTSKGWGELADGAFAIINLAGAGIADGRWTKSRKELILNSRVHAGAAVVDAVSKAAVKPQVVIQSSGVGYYGSRNGQVLDESSAPVINGFSTEVVQEWEKSTVAVREMGVRHVVTRIGPVLSMDGGALPKLVLPFQLFVGGPIGKGEQWMSWVHWEDNIRAIRFLLENKAAEGAYNLTAPNPVKYVTIANKIGHVLAKPAFFPAPAIALKVLLGEMSEVILQGQRVVPTRLIDAGFNFKFSDVETALRDILITNAQPV